MSKVIAVLCSDIHLSHKPPVARSSEDDWYAAMARTLDQVLDISNEHTAPLIIAGDLFDRWNSQPELINFAMGSFRAFQHGVYAIPGQHDLPYHDYTEIHKSAYYTLVKAGVIIDIQPSSYGHHSSTKDITFWSFPWSFDVFSIDNDAPMEKQMEQTKKLITKVLRNSVPDATDEEINNISLEHLEPLMTAITKLHKMDKDSSAKIKNVIATRQAQAKG